MPRTPSRLATWVLGLVALFMPLGRAVECFGQADDGEAKPISGEQQTTIVPGRLAPSRSFRPILIPDDRKAELVRGMVPVRKADFLDKWRRLQLMDQSRRIEARVESSVYRATLQGNTWIDGEAELVVESIQKDQAVMLPLGRVSLALSNARWAKEKHNPPHWGASRNGDSWLLVEGRREFLFDWSFRGVGNAVGETEFRFELPASLNNTLELTTPAGVQLRSNAGIVRKQAIDTSEGDGPVLWTIDVGGRQRFSVYSVDATQPRQRQLGVVQKAEYRLSRVSLEANIDLQIHVRGGPLSALELLADPRLVLISAKSGDEFIPDEAIQQLDQDGGWRKWRISLPRPLRGGAGTIQLRVFSRSPLDESWTLPQVRVDPSEWSATEVALDMAPELELRRFAVNQSHHHNLTRTAQGKLRLQFQHFQAAGEIELVIGERRFNPQVASGVHLQLHPDKIAARLIADVSTEQGELYAVTVSPAPGWQVVSVATDPPESLMRDEFEWRSDSPFVVPLTSPASKDNPVRLLIDAVRDYPRAAKRTRMRDAQIVEFPDVTREHRLIRVTSGENAQAVLSGDVEVVRLAPHDLSEAQIERLGGSSGVLFEGGARAARATAFLRRQASSFDVAVKTTIDVEEQTTRETYVSRCAANAGSLSDVVVRFNQRRSGDVAWSISGHPNGIVSSVREPLGEGDVGEQWRITFRQALEKPFELVGQRDSPNGGSFIEAALIDVVGAATQVSSIVVQSGDKTPLGLTPAGLEPATIPPPSPGHYSVVQAAYRHESARTASLRIKRLKGVQPACWVWRMNTFARLEKHGSVGYQSVLRIENSGRRQMSIKVPEDTVDWIVYVDDLEAAAFKNGRTITVPLPDLRLRPTVVLRYRTQRRPIRWLGSIMLHSPKLDMAVLRRDWTVSLPPGFEEWPRNGAWDWRKRISSGILSTLLNSLRREQQGLRSLWSAEDESVMASLSHALERQPATFSELAEHWSDELVIAGDHVVVDQQSLAAVTILPESELPTQPQTRSPADTKEWLDRRGIALQRQDSVWVLRADEGFVNSTDVPTDRTIPLAEWGRDATRQNKAWDGAVAVPMSQSNRRQLRFSETDQVETSIYNRSTYAAWEWCAACIALALTLRLANRFFSLALAIAMTLIALTLWVPPHVVFLTRGALLGVIVAAVVSHLIQRSATRISPADELDHDSANTRALPAAVTATVLISGLLVLAYASRADGQESTAGFDRFGLPNDRPNVLIPADETLKPVGDFYYVTPSLHRQLLNANSSDGGSELGWLVRDAVYTLRVEQEALSEVNARMSIDVRRSGPIDAPFPGSRVRTAFWDGRPVTFKASDQSIEVYASDVGLHELELVLEPQLVQEVEPIYSIPAQPTPNATLVLEGAEKLSEVRFPSARGAVRRLDVDRWAAQLGRVDQVDVRWQGLGQPADVREIEVDELYWLRVRPNSVSVEAQLQLRPLSNDVRQFAMLVEPDLQLLNIGREQGVESHESIAASDDWVLHRFVLEKAIESERTLRLSFLWKGVGGVGRIPAPRLKVDARYVRDRRMALSVAAPLLWDLSRDDLWESLAPAEFASAWGDEGAPLSAFRAPREELPWMLRTRYPELNSSAEGEMIVVVENTKLICELTASFLASTTDRYQHRFSVPKGFRVNSATLFEGDRERPIQARLDQDGQLSLFSEKPLTESHRLRLQGEVDRQGGTFELPTFDIIEGRLTVDSARVYRRPDVGPLRWVKLSGFDKDLPEDGGFSTEHGRLEAVLTRNNDNPTALLQTTSRKNSAPQGVIVTSLTREQGRWQATSNFQVTAGDKSPIDVLRFEVPLEWTELQFEPNWAFRMAPLPTPGRQQLVVYPPSPITETARLTIRGTLSTEGEDRLRQAPEITPLDLRRTDRYFVLPMRLENQRYVWEISGREKEPPSSLKPDMPAEGEYQSILAVGKSQATVQIVRQLAGSLKIQSADYRLRWRDNREAYGVAQFDVDAAGSQHCLLSAPTNVELLRVAVDGIEHHMIDATQRSIAIRLGPEQLPQRISVVFLVRDAVADGQAAPYLSDDRNAPLPCETTLWTIDAANREELKLKVADSNAFDDQITHNLARLRLATTAIQTVSKRDTGATQDDLGAWFSARSSRISQLQSQLGRAAERCDREAGESASVRSREIREAIAASADLEKTVSNRFTSTPKLAFGPVDNASAVWDLDSAEDAQHFHAAYADTQQAMIPVFAADPVTDSDTPQWLLAGFLMLSAIPILGAPAFRGAREWFAAWPQTSLAAIGLAWWAYGPLPWLGLALALVMLASSLDSCWCATRR